MPNEGLVPTTDDTALVIVVLAVYLLVLWLPGGVIGAFLGLRGWVLAAAAPVLTYFVVGLSGPLSGAVGVSWSPLTAGVAVAVVAGVAWVVRRLAARRATEPPSDDEADRRLWSPLATAALGVVVTGVAVTGFAVVAGGMGDLSTVPQDWDAMLHANGIRYLADTGDGGLYGMTTVNWYAADPVFYPNAYHLLGSVVYELTGAPIPVVLNVLSALMPGMLALSLVALVRRFGGRAVTAGYAAVIALAATSVVFDNLWRGPLLPFTVGLVATPLLIIVLDRHLHRPTIESAAVLAATSVGLLALHPSTLFGAVMFAVPLLAQRWWRRATPIGPDLLRLAAPAAIGAVLGAPLLLGALASAGETLTFDWPATYPVSRSVGSLLVFQHDLGGPQLSLAVPLWVGLLTFRRLGRLRWLVGCAALFGGLFVAAASYDNIWVIRLTSPWWNDQYRLIALATVPLCVIAGHGLAVVQHWLASLVAQASRHRIRLGLRLSLVMSVLVLAVLAVLSDGLYANVNATKIARGYQHDERGTVTRGEVEAMRELGTLVRPGERTMNDRGDGTGWMYAIAGAEPVAGHFVSDGVSADARLLGERFTRYRTDPSVRAAVDRLNVRYVLVGSGFVRENAYRETGLWNLGGQPFLDEVYRNDDAVIYRIERDS